jgi:hypothetical protein
MTITSNNASRCHRSLCSTQYLYPCDLNSQAWCTSYVVLSISSHQCYPMIGYRIYGNHFVYIKTTKNRPQETASMYVVCCRHIAWAVVTSTTQYITLPCMVRSTSWSLPALSTTSCKPCQQAIRWAPIILYPNKPPRFLGFNDSLRDCNSLVCTTN